MVYQFLQFFNRDFLFLDERGYSRKIGVIEVILYHTCNGTTTIFRLSDDGIILVGITKLLVIKNYFNNSYLSAVSSFVKEEKISVEELKELIDKIENNND